MRQYFSFNPQYYNYWPIYEAIGKYYPIGIGANDWPEFRQEYPGTKALNQLITDYIFDEKKLGEWDAFQKQVGHSLQKEIRGYTNIHYPAYTAEVLLETFNYDKVSHHQKICFSVSLAGPFFTLYGIDETTVNIYDAHSQASSARAINAITASPCGDFETAFIRIDKMIRERFTGYKLIPLSVSTMYVRGVYNKFAEIDESTVYHSLFGHLPDECDVSKMIYGDGSYGSGDWRTNEPIPGDWAAYPLLSGDQAT